MLRKTKLACVTALLLPIYGCQSLSTPRIQPVAAQCLPPPAPAAWFMEPRAPDLTQRMLNELSVSPTTATKD
ncbi:lysis system o-spanin lipoprotein Rz1 [Pseudomonas chlororaphis]|uniref:lysis system o-spanin lipoprotein Rz1 n=1 Tax=Pseudomonas chlororaphis TaxID=587753 RepID=UPI0038B95504